MKDINVKNEKKIDALYDKMCLAYEDEDYNKSKEYLLEAWNLLPNPKTIYEYSYSIVEALCDIYSILEDKENAFKWLDVFIDCYPEKYDYGDREFVIGRTYYEFDDFEKAYENFQIAFRKSDGRAFNEEDNKYLKFLMEMNKNK